MEAIRIHDIEIDTRSQGIKLKSSYNEKPHNETQIHDGHISAMSIVKGLALDTQA